MNISYTSREQIEVYRFSLPVAIGVPLLAILLQAFVPLHLHFFAIFDLPLLVTIFFAVARRNQISGIATGTMIGIVQDSLTHHAIGVYGLSKTFIGFFASSLGVKLDVENPGSRLLMTFVFYLLHQLVYFAVARGMLGQSLQIRWGYLVLAAFANGVLAVFLFAVLDRFKQRT